MQTVSVFLVDAHMVVRAGLKTLITAHPDMTVFGEAGDGATAWQAVHDCRPNVVITEITLPTLTGIQLTERISQTCPDVKVLVLSRYDDTCYLRHMLAVGASGYILKHTAADTLIEAARVVAAGGRYLDPSLAEHAVTRPVCRPASVINLLGAALSEHEREVVQHVALGYTNQDIATQLGLQLKTILTCRAHAMEKLGLTSRTALVRYTLAQGWLHSC